MESGRRSASVWTRRKKVAVVSHCAIVWGIRGAEYADNGAWQCRSACAASGSTFPGDRLIACARANARGLLEMRRAHVAPRHADRPAILPRGSGRVMPGHAGALRSVPTVQGLYSAARNAVSLHAFLTSIWSPSRGFIVKSTTGHTSCP